MKPNWRSLARWGPALLLMVLIFVFSAIPSKEIPNFGKFDTLVKKLGHMLEYALLGLAYLRGINKNKFGAFFLAWIITILYATSDEFHQSFVPGRHASPLDVGIDGVGALLGVSLSALWQFIPQIQARNRRPHPRSP